MNYETIRDATGNFRSIMCGTHDDGDDDPYLGIITFVILYGIPFCRRI